MKRALLIVASLTCFMLAPFAYLFFMGAGFGGFFRPEFLLLAAALVVLGFVLAGAFWKVRRK